MKIFHAIIVIIILNSCQTNHSDKKRDIVSNDTTTPIIGIHVIDTLNKYAASDSMFDYSYQRLYVGKANNIDFGFLSLTDTSFTVFQKLGNRWTMTDTFLYPLFYVDKPTDINGDNFQDIIITYSVSAAGSNGQNICLLFNPQTKKFIHNRYFDLPNIKYDKQRNLVLSAWWGAAVHCQQKMCYKITGDSLIFYMGVTLCPEHNNDGEPAGVQFYKIKNGNRIIIRAIKGNSDKVWQTFENAIWNSKNDY